MPLLPGKENIGKNISELESTGKYTHKQAIAIALNNAREHQRHSHAERQAPLHEHELRKYGR
jgi:hypothetical protein